MSATPSEIEPGFDETDGDAFAAGNETETPTGGTVRRRLSARTLFMGAFVAVAAGSLWSMRAIDRAQASGPVAGGDAQREILAAIEESRTAARETDAKVLLDLVEKPAGPASLPAGRDPFRSWGTAEASGSAGNESPEADDEAEARQWEEAVDAAAATVRIVSAMVGSGGGVANVNGHMMRPGDTFAIDGSDAEFRIESIAADGVTLVATDAATGRTRPVTVPLVRKW
jgi:hypothetical protein